MRLLAASTMTTPETIIRMRGTAILLAIFKSYGYPEIEGTFRLKKIDQKYSRECLNEWTDTRVPRGGSDGVHTTCYTGLQVSRICLGTLSFGHSDEWMIEIDKATPIVQRALDLG